MTKSETINIEQENAEEVQDASDNYEKPNVEDANNIYDMENTEDAPPAETQNDNDYEQRARQDLEEIQTLYPSLSYMTHLSDLKNAARFATLRDMGLTVEEAFLASNAKMIGSLPHYDNRSHLKSSVPRGSFDGSSQMSRSEMEEAKALFGNLSDREIRDLFKRAKS